MQVEDERRHADQYKEQVGESQVGWRSPPWKCFSKQVRTKKMFSKTFKYGV